MRSADWVARYGGEEFVVVLPETNVVEGQRSAAEHLRAQSRGRTVRRRWRRVSGDRQLRRVGLERRDVPHGATLDALMAKCDAGVYASKAAGRNRVTTESMD